MRYVSYYVPYVSYNVPYVSYNVPYASHYVPQFVWRNEHVLEQCMYDDVT